jgi:hypothetical protein
MCGLVSLPEDSGGVGLHRNDNQDATWQGEYSSDSSEAPGWCQVTRSLALRSRLGSYTRGRNIQTSGPDYFERTSNIIDYPIVELQGRDINK